LYFKNNQKNLDIKNNVHFESTCQYKKQRLTPAQEVLLQHSGGKQARVLCFVKNYGSFFHIEVVF
jgi:hypothetical protein